MTSVPDRELRRAYRRRFLNFLKHRRDPGDIHFYVTHLAMHYHAYTLARMLMPTGAEGSTERRPMLVNSF